jgi:hypothetical protein
VIQPEGDALRAQGALLSDDGQSVIQPEGDALRAQGALL